MYMPDAFRLDDRAALLDHIAKYAFATVITHGSEGIVASHLPLLANADGTLLSGHLARANHQFGQLASRPEALAIFHGPHAYVSPSVYLEQPSVPTWNYAVVHARGHARLVDERRLRAILDEMVARFDSTGWRLDAPDEFVRAKLDAIAGFEIDVDRLEGKWKLSQNRSEIDQVKVAECLERGDEQSRALAALMRERLSGVLPRPQTS
jgi:transcriptional regulator